MKLISWNVRRKSVANVDFVSLLAMKPDIIAFQELRPAYKSKLSDNIVESLSEYLQIWNNIGYGMAVFTRLRGFKMMSIDFNGRTMTFEFDDFLFVNLEGPLLFSFGSEDYITWFKAFRRFLIKLSQIKPVIVGGTFNIMSNNPDIPPEDAMVMKNILNINFVDTFNELHPDVEEAYTYRTVKNGFDRRTDYFFVSDNLKDKIKSATIEEDPLGSNHRPITLDIEI
ncbi:MAG: endonuclease/exonuclease/phosphatase family protein [Selenomonadaceae bacterium]|nr:endonuclease/exonuclease/phosphatase family protein [Selenomonadaceae bacterium]